MPESLKDHVNAFVLYVVHNVETAEYWGWPRSDWKQGPTDIDRAAMYFYVKSAKAICTKANKETYPGWTIVQWEITEQLYKGRKQ